MTNSQDNSTHSVFQGLMWEIYKTFSFKKFKRRFNWWVLFFLKHSCNMNFKLPVCSLFLQNSVSCINQIYNIDLNYIYKYHIKIVLEKGLCSSQNNWINKLVESLKLTTRNLAFSAFLVFRYFPICASKLWIWVVIHWSNCTSHSSYFNFICCSSSFWQSPEPNNKVLPLKLLLHREINAVRAKKPRKHVLRHAVSKNATHSFDNIWNICHKRISYTISNITRIRSLGISIKYKHFRRHTRKRVRIESECNITSH